MQKLLCAAMVIAATTIGSSVWAGEPTDPWKAWIEARQADKAHSAKQVAQIENSYRLYCSVAAKGEANQQACLAAYRLLIATAQKDLAIADFWLAATATDPKSRDELLKIVPVDETIGDYAISTRRSKEIGRFFSGKTATSTTSGSGQ